MKLNKSLLWLAISCCAIPTYVQAEQYMFTYSKLFSQVKVNAEERIDDVKVGVFFIDAKTKKTCRIEKAWMEKEEHYEEIASSAHNELLLPLDNNLREANPLVYVNLPMDTRCDFAFMVMTKEPLKGEVGYQQVADLLPQMQVTLEELGGMFASWFTPDVEGVTLEFPEGTNGNIVLSSGETIKLVDRKAVVTLAQIGKGGHMLLPSETIRVLPYLPKAK